MASLLTHFSPGWTSLHSPHHSPAINLNLSRMPRLCLSVSQNIFLSYYLSKTQRKIPVIFVVVEDALQEEPGSLASPVSLLQAFLSYLRAPRSTRGPDSSSSPIPGHPPLVSHTSSSSPMPSASQESPDICLCHHALHSAQTFSSSQLWLSCTQLLPYFLGIWITGEGFRGWAWGLTFGRTLQMTVSQGCCHASC